MSKKQPTNTAASVRQRLLNKARADKRTFNELLQYFAMDRFLYRLSHSIHADKFVLKGALMLRAWKSPIFRPTMDIDMLAQRTSNEVAEMEKLIRSICETKVDSDGLEFDSTSVQGVRIVEDADYEGVRILFSGKLDTARIRMQVDIGFGDVIYPGPQNTEMPVILDFPPAVLNAYSLESSIAEKFEAMIKLDSLNSRMKDFYDIWLLSRQFDFRSHELQRAIELTLQNRNTELPEIITAFTDNFIQGKSTQWNAFRRKINTDNIPIDFYEVVNQIKQFLTPALEGVQTGMKMNLQWKAPGPWKG
ncbi:MAG: nucleotidyl transferase AbiEii/AbiGii toxin family protein [Desulforhopalus sp.]